MTIGLVGRKVGMTRIFTDDGDTLPVTVLDVSDNRVTQIKTAEKDGYAAVQVAFGKRRANRVNKPLAGHLAKAAVEAGQRAEGIPLAKPEELGELKVGGKVGVEIFKVGQQVDVQGVDHRQGLRRRHQAPPLRRSERARTATRSRTACPGSTGQNQSPGRVFKGKRMPGHLGNARRTIPNLEIVRIDAERQLLLVKGSVPGSSGRDVVVRLAVKGQKAPVKVRPSRGPPSRRRKRPSRRRSPRSLPPSLRRRAEHGTQDHQRQGRCRHRAGDRRGVRRATSTRRWCTSSWSPTRRTRASARARRRTAARCSHSTKKPWRQKGTGRARAGMTSSPLWRGGGKIFPNSPDENFTHKVNRKMYRAGMASILSQLAREDRLRVVDEFTLDAPKTKLLAQKVKSMGFEERAGHHRRRSTRTCMLSVAQPARTSR